MYPRGKGVGGTSLINCLLYTRGSEYDYERWSKLLNDSSWSFENLLPYFKKSENFTRTNFQVPFDVNYHGFHGPLHMTQSYPPQKISNNILEGSQQMGYDIIDSNGVKHLGSSIFQIFASNGRRFDPEMAFLSTIKGRKNLRILDGSYVTKIEVCNTTKQVKGVIFTRQSKTYVARIRNEVILSAGTISSPQILMLSGIGPQEHLESLRIPIIQNLPVGVTLRDHSITSVILSSNFSVEPQSLRDSVNEFLHGKGSLTRSFPIDAVSWFRTPIEPNVKYPDMEFVYFNVSGSALGQKLFGWSAETYNALNPNVSNPFSINLTPCHPKSYGTVTLKSADPFDYPLIDPNLLSTDEDLETIFQGVLRLQRLLDTESFKKMNVRFAVDQFPGCSHAPPLSKEYWYCYIRSVTGIGYHPVGTCPTATSPKTGVVDNKLKVFGVTGLRVADASVIPFPLSAHPNAPCNMIGEKISDIIKSSYKY